MIDEMSYLMICTMCWRMSIHVDPTRMLYWRLPVVYCTSFALHQQCKLQILINMILYLQECPQGFISEEKFRAIYSRFFPYGGKHIFCCYRTNI